MKNQVVAYIRTYAPIVAAGIVTAAANIGLELGEHSEALASLIGTLGGFVYYLIARLVGKKLPRVEAFMLGSSKTPEYTEAKG